MRVFMCFTPANQPPSGTVLPAAPADTQESTRHPGVSDFRSLLLPVAAPEPVFGERLL